MTTEYPSYYDSFFCMAGSCPDTCCAGWEIEVDDETYYRYLTIPGPFGDRLRQALSERQEDGEYLHYLERRGNGSCTSVTSTKRWARMAFVAPAGNTRAFSPRSADMSRWT